MGKQACEHGVVSGMCMTCLAQEMALEAQIVNELVAVARDAKRPQDERDGGD